MPVNHMASRTDGGQDWRARYRFFDLPADHVPTPKEAEQALRKGDAWPIDVATRYDLHRSPQGGAVVWPPDVPVTRQYFASLHSQLPFEIAKLRKNDPEAVQRFVATWGLLGYERVKLQDLGESFTLPNRPDAEAARRQVEQQLLTARGGIAAARFGYEPLTWIWAHAHGIEWILSIHQDLQERNVDAVTEAVTALPRAATSNSRTLECAIAWDGPISYLIPVPIDLEELTRTIRIIINHNLRGVNRAVGDYTSPAGLGVPQFNFRALIHCAYWHLADVFDRSVGVARCDNCGDWFSKSGPRERFCPPPPGRSESLCGARARKKQSRANKRQASEARQ